MAGEGELAVPQWLVRRAQTHPDKPALIAEGRTWTFAGLSAAAERAAAALRAQAVAPGARVGVLSHNSAALVVVLHGLWRLGATAVPLNYRLTPSEIAQQLGDVKASVLLASHRLQELGAEAVAALQEAGEPPRLLSLEGAAGNPSCNATVTGPPRPASGHPAAGDKLPVHRFGDTQVIMFTSGTTGRPKGARLTYQNAWWSAVSSALNLGLHSDDAWLACLPLCHIGGLSILNRSVIYGIPAIVHERFDPQRVNREIDTGRVTIVSVVATMLEQMLDERGDRPYPPSLRCVLIGGGPVSERLLERALAADVPLVQTYGMTETSSQIATLAPADARRKAGSAGKPLMGAELRIAAAPGEVGEILVRGPVLTPGYFGEPPGAHLDADGWFHTGDLGYLDAEGFLYVVSRRTDLIISGGENVYPAEVERVLSSHPGVKEAAVVARPHPVWGEVPVAFFVPAGPAVPDADELAAHCRAQLAKFKVPAAFFPVPSLPRNATGKVLRTELRRRAIAEGGPVLA